MDENYLDLLACLNVNKVHYLIVGGYAVIRYSEPRYTKDLDIWIESSPTNAKRVLKGLTEFGAPVDNLTVKELAKPGLIYVFGVPPLRVDIINRAGGVSFSSAWKHRERVNVGGLQAYFIGRKDLIKQKRSAGRPQDLADLVKLL